MKFFTDTANLSDIRAANDLGILDGVTTHPSLMAKENIRGWQFLCKPIWNGVDFMMVKNDPVPMEYGAVNDSFGESGKPDQLMKKYGLDDEHIIKAVQKVLSRKG